MKSTQRILVAAAAIIGAFSGITPTVGAQDEAPGTDASEKGLTSGPAADTMLTPVMCYANSGRLAGKEFDAVALLGKAPCVLLFIHELTRNTAPVLRGLDELATEYALLGFKSRTILLAGDRTAAEAQLKRVNGSLRFTNPIVLSIDGAEGPGNYALNRNAALTLVFAKEGKVTRSLALTDTGPNDVPVIRKEIIALTGELPGDPAELRKLVVSSLPEDPKRLRQLAADQAIELKRMRAQIAQLRENARGGAAMRRRPDQMKRAPNPPARGEARERPQRQGKAPEDPELNQLLRSLIRQSNTDERNDEVIAQIKDRAAQSDELKAEAVEMFKLMLSFPDRYGTGHAQELAASFLKQHAPATEK